ncbi:hypothetical protein HK103_004698 [Boothiomyces macroporosus]|uniref:C5orf34-like C-terminal domain-containing protein n=1 Tax=Boothiomyces macroporosus TaxID=261099 RepID=A0AAD5UN00_9FUNG|nr:hypothetical protein HK103_004698 [Boothiomyces macroporosus]
MESLFIFRDNSCSGTVDNKLIHFSPTGAVVIVDGCRFLTNALPSKYHQCVKALLEFRNSFTDPYIPEILFKEDVKLINNEPLEFTRWERNSKPTEKIVSIDRLVTLTFNDKQQLFSVTYPYPVHLIEANRKIHYTVITQLFSPSEIPLYWKYPAAVLLGQDTTKISVVGKSDQYVTTTIPTFNLANTSPSNSLNSMFNANFINFLQFSAMKPIKAVRTKTDLFLVSPSGQIQIVLDNAALISDLEFKFFTLYNGTCDLDVYRVDSSVQWITNTVTGQEYQMKNLVTTSLSLYQNCVAYQMNEPKENTRDPPLNVNIKDEVSVPEVGLFTMYQSGGVRGAYTDGTIIEFGKEVTDTSPAQVTDNSGQKFQIRVLNPIGYEDKIKHLLDFKKWFELDEQTRKRVTIQREYERNYYQKLISRSQMSTSMPFEKSITELLLTMQKRNLEFLEQSKTC